MPPRLYSIASSLRAHPDEVHLTVAVVRHEGHGRKRKAFARPTWPSGWEKSIPATSIRTKFQVPESPDIPIIMVGPGTGSLPSEPSWRKDGHRGKRKKLVVLR